MTIKNKVNQILDTYSYNFCEIDFTLFGTDFIMIYDKPNGVCLYSNTLAKLKAKHNIPWELANKEHKKEELIKLHKDSPLERATFAVCFYLDTPEKIEPAISSGTRFV